MNHWKGKEILVTGADGFVGSHLTEKLLSLEAEVTAYVKGSSTAGHVQCQLKNINHLRPKLADLIVGDIGHSDSVNLIKKANPEIIFHLAASAYVPFSFNHPREVIHTNLDGTLNVLEAAMNSSVKQVVCTSSSEIYGTAQTDKIAEDHPLNPSSPYGASKVAADRCAYSYWNTYQLPVAIIRPFNMYGPRHTYDVIPKFISLALEGKPLTIYGSGEQSRDMMYIDDAINAFLLMGSEKSAQGKAVNFGTGITTSINDIAKKIKELSGSSSEVVHIEARKSEVDCLKCDASLAEKLFGWKANVSVDDGIRRNIEWVRRANHD